MFEELFHEAINLISVEFSPEVQSVLPMSMTG